MIAAVVISIGIVAGAPLLFAWQDGIVAELSRRAGTALPGDIVYAILGIQLMIAVTSVLGYFFIRHLRRIVDTVAEGDPFIPDNARRLRHMGWLAVAVQLVALPAGALAGWFAHVSHVQYVDVGFSIGGMLLALILFVLARIFRKGAEMRDELEGTV